MGQQLALALALALANPLLFWRIVLNQGSRGDFSGCEARA